MNSNNGGNNGAAVGNNIPISITKGYLSPTLSPSFFPLNVGDDSSLPFLSLDKTSIHKNNSNSNMNTNNNGVGVTTSLSKLGDMTRGRGRQRSFSNSSFNGETPLSLLTKRTSSVSPIRFPSTTTSTTTTNANGAALNSAPRMFRPEYFKNVSNHNNTNNAATTLSSLLSSTTNNNTSNVSTSNGNVANQNINGNQTKNDITENGQKNNAQDSNIEKQNAVSSTNFNTIAQLLSSHLNISNKNNTAPTSVKKRKKKTLASTTSSTKSAPTKSKIKETVPVKVRDITPKSCTGSDATTAVPENRLVTMISSSKSNNMDSIPDLDDELKLDGSIHNEYDNVEQQGEEDDLEEGDIKNKDFLIEKFLDAGQKHFTLDNMTGGINSRNLKENNDEEDDDEIEDNDSIPVDFVEMVEQSGLLSNNNLDEIDQERFISNANRLRNSKNIYKHMKRYSHISNFSAATTAIPPSIPSQWEPSTALSNPGRSISQQNNYQQNESQIKQHQHHVQQPQQPHQPHQHQQQQQQQLSSYPSKFELAEKQLNELQQQQLDLRMKQMELQIEELRLTNEKLRYAINDQKNSQLKLVSETAHEPDMNDRVRELESKIESYKDIITKLTDITQERKPSMQISQHQHNPSRDTSFSCDTSRTPVELNSFQEDNAFDAHETTSDSQLHVKKLRMSKIDSKQLEQLTRSRKNSGNDSMKVTSDNIQLLEDYPFTTKDITDDEEYDCLEKYNEKLYPPQKDTLNSQIPHKTLHRPTSSVSQMDQWKQSMDMHKDEDTSYLESNCSNSFENTTSEIINPVFRGSHKKPRSGYNLNLSIEIEN